MNSPASPTIDRMLRETLALLERTRALVQGMQPDLDRLPVDGQVLVVRECSRVTGRLTAVLSWLLSRKAAAAGEYPEGDERAVVPLFGVGDARLDPDLGAVLPDWEVPFIDLVNDCAALYKRAARMDEGQQGRRRSHHGRARS